MILRLSPLGLALGLGGLFVTMTGCDTASPDLDPVRPAQERGALGKADLIGSCADGEANFCGGKSDGTCWCDELCVEYGDCCTDAAEVCGLEPEPTACGGFAGLACPDGLVCVDDPDDACDPQNGGADCIGICVEEEPQPQFCGGFGGFPCPEGMICVDDPDDGCDPDNGGADCGGICVTDPAECPPVLCELFCPFGFAEGDDGCPTCTCAEQPTDTACTNAGGICEVGFITECPQGFEVSPLGCGPSLIETVCCAPAEPAPDSCEGHCGTQAQDCWCDDLCSFYGDCCDDVAQWCE